MDNKVEQKISFLLFLIYVITLFNNYNYNSYYISNNRTVSYF